MKKQKQDCDLKSCMYCQLCIPEWLPAIGANRKIVSIKKGELLFNEGDVMTGIYFVNNGTVKVHKQWGQKELIVRFAKNGDIVGHRGLGADNIYPVSGTALENVTACFIPLDFFMSSLKINYDFMQRLMLFFAEELKQSERKMRNLAHMSVKGRVANALLLLQNKFGVKPDGHINILLSRQDLASYAGTTYETVFRIMSDLAEQQLLKVDGKKITILNQEALEGFTKDE
ncbi:Crp/Fnr family transcriptional regulator [Ferruginibacter paludis]|uniref:Crp/Fnr family transcriptional regulator n=1 Tax=Ferruginibacter paludis TaxID=1310417 RepID=UPI0025B2EBEB|nr:Crp/Fnr family transcriptional regulator [Ferruginibacter paludis]MDN3654321.1 Crp/Fnr family transcriptional regulator [Ferruginibacter paludis]